MHGVYTHDSTVILLVEAVSTPTETRMAIAENINLFALYADMGTMTDPRESEPSESLMTITAGELVEFADAVRAYERCLLEGGDYERQARQCLPTPGAGGCPHEEDQRRRRVPTGGALRVGERALP